MQEKIKMQKTYYFSIINVFAIGNNNKYQRQMLSKSRETRFPIDFIKDSLFEPGEIQRRSKR